MKDSTIITVIAMVLLFIVGMTFLNKAYGYEVVTVNFKSVGIAVKGEYIQACEVERNGQLVIIPAPCREVAAEMRAEICDNLSVDVDSKFECRRHPTVTFDFVIDGVHTGVI